MTVQLRLRVLIPENADMTSFIRYWGNLYKGPPMDSYTRCMTRKRLYIDHIFELFDWRFGYRVRWKKRALTELEDHMIVINQLRKNYDEDIFLKTFRRHDVDNRIFLRHIIQPNLFPVYETRLSDAWRYMESLNYWVSSYKIEVNYLEKYRPFYDAVCDSSAVHSRTEVYCALWAFGQFLNTYPAVLDKNNVR